VTEGQFGSLSDMMSYSAANHTAYVAVNYRASDKASLFANVAYNDGHGALGNLYLNPSGLPGIPPGFDYGKISEIGRFSALGMRWVEQVYGLNYQFHPRWMLSISGYWASFKDRRPYLINATGRTAGVQGGLSYVF